MAVMENGGIRGLGSQGFSWSPLNTGDCLSGATGVEPNSEELCVE